MRSAVARASNGAWGYSTVWRVAFRAGIELTAGRETMGRHRLSAEQRAAVIEARRIDAKATQAEIARSVGISRPSVSRIIPRRRHNLEIVL
jgi:CRP-like cAMP-binding protein